MIARALAMAASLCATTALQAAETPHPVAADPRVRWVNYDDQEVYRIVGAFRSATQILLAEDETIEHVALGDTVSWEVAVAGHILFLKPREKAGATNLIVTAARGGVLRNYTFELSTRAGPISRNTPDTFFQVRFRYPADERAKAVRLSAAQDAMRLAVLEGAAIKGALDRGVLEGTRNLAYKVQGSAALQPSEVSDNGQFTVLRFPANQEIPAIYLVREDGSESLVPFDVRDEFAVVHMVARQFRLRRGSEVLCIYNQAPPAWGLDHGTNTGSSHVDRTMRERND